MFQQAESKAPYIIFIDELDALGKTRGSGAIGGHDEREQTLNALLVEMDGFDSNSGVIILGATNRPETLDPALLKLPQSLLDVIPPRPPEHGLGQESFTRFTGVLFDPLAPAASAVSLTLDVLFNQQRAARMNAFNAADATLPGFDSLLNTLMNASWYQARQNATQGAIQRGTGYQVLHRLMALPMDVAATPHVHPNMVSARAGARASDSTMAGASSEKAACTGNPRQAMVCSLVTLPPRSTNSATPTPIGR